MDVTDGSNPSSSVATAPTYGKDSMNFAEWPLAVLHAKRRHDEPVTITDTVRHPKTGDMVERSLTIDPSRKYGHPTSPDVDVLLGLIQLTAQQGFSDPAVIFTRYELQQIIRWPKNGNTFRRIDDAVRRWKSITLTYKRAWWDTEKEDWLSVSFNPIARAFFYDKPRHPIRIEWDNLAFADFNRNIKPLNLDLYFSLKRAGAKQLYAYLDKHWHRRRRLTYDLKHAAAHAGYSSHQPNKELKRLLQKDCQDLSTRGGLNPLPRTKRFEQVRRGVWRIHFEKPTSIKATPKQTALLAGTLDQQLIDLGISKPVAAKLVNDHPAERINEHIDVFNWFNAKSTKSDHKKPGWLRKAIEDDFDHSKLDGYQTKQQREAAVAKMQQQAKQSAEKKQREAKQQELEEIKTAQLEQRWQQTSPQQRDAILQHVIDDNRFLQQMYHKDPDSSLIHELCLSELDRRTAA